jgi:propanediol dehydratase large subunit
MNATVAKKFWTANPMMAILAASVRRRTVLTSAKIQRAVEAVKNAGLKVKGVTISVDGTITVNTGEDNQPAAKDKSKTPLPTLGEALNGKS